MIAAGHDPASIPHYTVPQFRLYLEAAVRRENRAFLESVEAGRYAWASEQDVKALRRDLLG